MTDTKRPFARHCSFCGKSQYEVRKLIAGKFAHICSECLVICVDVLAEPSNPKEPA